MRLTDLRVSGVFENFVYQEESYSDFLARGRINKAKIDLLPVDVYISRVPWPNFPKPINPNCLLKTTRLFFSLHWLFSRN